MHFSHLLSLILIFLLSENGLLTYLSLVLVVSPSLCLDNTIAVLWCYQIKQKPSEAKAILSPSPSYTSPYLHLASIMLQKLIEGYLLVNMPSLLLN